MHLPEFYQQQIDAEKENTKRLERNFAEKETKWKAEEERKTNELSQLRRSLTEELALTRHSLQTEAATNRYNNSPLTILARE